MLERITVLIAIAIFGFVHLRTVQCERRDL